MRHFYTVLLAVPFLVYAACNDDRMTRPIIADTFCTLTECCAEIEQHFVDTFTALQALKNSVTTCCDEILVQLDSIGSCSVDIAGTFTSLDLFQSTLTSCCASFESTLTEILSNLVGKECACQATPITAAGTITSAGVYCLENDIVGEIIIASDNVVLDLNDHEISGGNNGIAVNENMNNIVIGNGRIRNTTGEGVLIAAGCNNIEIVALNLINTGGYAVSLLGTATNQINNCTVKEITAQACTGSVAIAQANGCIVVDSSFSASSNSVVTIDTGAHNIVQRCLITDSIGFASIIASNQAALVVNAIEINGSAQVLALNNCPEAVVDGLKIADVITQNHVIQYQSCAAAILTNVVMTNISRQSASGSLLSISASPGMQVEQFYANYIRETVASSSLIGVSASNNCALNEIRVHDFVGANAIVFVSGSLSVLMRDISADSCTITSGGFGAITIDTSNSYVLDGCQLLNLQEYSFGIFIQASLFGTIKNVLINGMDMTTLGSAAILTAEAFFSIIEDVIIQDINCTQAVSGIFVRASIPPLPQLATIIRNCLVQRINCDSGAVNGIRISSTSADASNVIIDQCTVLELSGNSGSCISIQSSAECIVKNCFAASHSASVDGYNIQGATQSNIANCIAQRSNVGFNLISNTGISVGESFAYDCFSTGFSDVIGVNNKIYNNYAAKSPARYAGIANVQNLAAAGPVVGVNIDGGA